MRKLLFVSVVGCLFIVPSPEAQVEQPQTAATLASVTGTYIFQLAELRNYSIEYNWTGRQVGFCTNGIPVGYGCYDTWTYARTNGTIVFDGAGHITSGSFTNVKDPRSYKCNPSNQPTNPCPVLVPSGNVYSAATAYGVGQTVDFTAGTTTRTFQAVRNNTGKAPDWTNTTSAGNICNNANMNTCYWVQISQSLTNGTGTPNTGTFTGTYTINANGSGVITFTMANCQGSCSSQISFVAPPVGQVGQTVGLVGISTLADTNDVSGTAVRIK